MEEVADRIVIDPDILLGKPVIKGTCIPVFLVVEFIANGMTPEEILEEYPELEKDDIKAAVLYASNCPKLSDLAGVDSDFGTPEEVKKQIDTLRAEY